jgi:protein involved in polysaccharide export with SLBB domain
MSDRTFTRLSELPPEIASAQGEVALYKDQLRQAKQEREEKFQEAIIQFTGEKTAELRKARALLAVKEYDRKIIDLEAKLDAAQIGFDEKLNEFVAHRKKGGMLTEKYS